MKFRGNNRLEESVLCAVTRNSFPFDDNYASKTFFIKKSPRKRTFFIQYYIRWLGRLDSNQRMAEPKTAALPLGDAPTFIEQDRKLQ